MYLNTKTKFCTNTSFKAVYILIRVTKYVQFPLIFSVVFNNLIPHITFSDSYFLHVPMNCSGKMGPHAPIVTLGHCKLTRVKCFLREIVPGL